MIQPLLGWKRRLRVTTTIYPGRSRKALQFPVLAPRRVAVFNHRFLPDRSSREFALNDLEALMRWEPDGLVASLESALSLADRQLRGLVDLASLRTALVVLTEFGGEALSDDYRELLWHAFGVPIFEQLRGPGGSIIARECEAHDGLHLDPAAKVTPEMAAVLLLDPCECGRETPRLRNYRRTRVTNDEGTWKVGEPVARQ